MPYPGGLFAAACHHAGHTCNPVPVAVDLDTCTNCNWMLNGCRFGAKRSMLLNYLPAARAHGAEIRPLHEVQSIGTAVTPGYRYQVAYTTVDPNDYRVATGGGVIEAKIVVLAAGTMGTPVILQRSAPTLGGVPNAVGTLLLAERRPRLDGADGRVADRVGARSAPHAHGARTRRCRSASRSVR